MAIQSTPLFLSIQSIWTALTGQKPVEQFPTRLISTFRIAVGSLLLFVLALFSLLIASVISPNPVPISVSQNCLCGSFTIR